MGLPVFGIIESLGSLGLGSSDPKKNVQRNADADRLFQLAMAGDAVAEANLRCRAGEQTALVSTSYLDSKGGCTLTAGSSPARVYAQAKVAELVARRTTGPAVAAVGLGALGAAEQIKPGASSGAITDYVSTQARRSIGGIPAWAVVLLVVVGGYIVVKKLF